MNLLSLAQYFYPKQHLTFASHISKIYPVNKYYRFSILSIFKSSSIYPNVSRFSVLWINKLSTIQLWYWRILIKQYRRATKRYPRLSRNCFAEVSWGFQCFQNSKSYVCEDVPETKTVELASQKNVAELELNCSRLTKFHF